MKIYISNLRIFATLAVIVIHTVANMVTSYGKTPMPVWHLANFIDSFSRFCVPVFVMISGALLLGKADSLKDFTLKRTKRIIYPFLFWSFIYAFRKASNYFEFKNDAIVIANNTIKLILNGASYHFWYLFMIIGIYLFIPILNVWIRNAKKNELHYFLTIWAVTLIYNTFTKFHLPPIELIYFSKYIGYLVLGYYLDQHLKIKNTTIWLGLILVLLGTFTTYFLTQYFSEKSQHFVVTFYNYTTLNVATIATGIFILFKALANSSNSFLAMLDKHSFGIYFVHILILEKLRGVIKLQDFSNSPFNALTYTLVTVISCYAFSFIIIFCLKKIKPLRNYIT